MSYSINSAPSSEVGTPVDQFCGNSTSAKNRKFVM